MRLSAPETSDQPRPGRIEDLRTAAWDPQAWAVKPTADQVAELYNLAQNDAQAAADWYAERKGRKSALSGLLRVAAVVLGVTGGLSPVIAGLSPGEAAQALRISQIGFLLIGLAAGLVVVDRLFGISSGWLRYMTTLTAIERRRAAFAQDWARLLLEAGAQPKVELFLARTAEFRAAVADLVDAETEAWVVEFRTSVSDLEAMVRSRREAGESVAAARLSPAAGAAAGSRRG